MRILVACEFSGTVRDAFIKRGHYAMSCDIEPSESKNSGDHHQGDVLEILDHDWDLMIAHPPCTHLASSGAKHFAKKIAGWTIINMQDENGYFYYQKWPFFTNKISYMRWNQAWMMFSLSLLINVMKVDN